MESFPGPGYIIILDVCHWISRLGQTLSLAVVEGRTEVEGGRRLLEKGRRISGLENEETEAGNRDYGKLGRMDGKDNKLLRCRRQFSEALTATSGWVITELACACLC
ncbi:hypothetical protein RRG08_031247 [Elysia crispata]|uniref:Uncharacterized protein n=1 Tax=Elysia crispata TaxID=231223 RepID=A0AAE1AK47_9GAST|nr:hypothetical protein RRG08_031247 [Elysia crispata]